MKKDVKSMIYTWSVLVVSVLLVMMITTSTTLAKEKEQRSILDIHVTAQL